MTHTLSIRHASQVVRWLCVLLMFPAFAAADLTTGFGDKKKKKKDGDGFLPEAKPINVRFIAGAPVEIELNAATPTQGAVRFVIREQPQHGTLSVIRPHARDFYKALVTYTPNPGDTVLVDRFTYACKLDEGSWSAPSPVTLTGKRAEPKIEIMQTSSFGRVLPGFEGSSKIALKNTGIAPFAADMQWQAPWNGPPRIELGIGEQKEYLITVKPSAPGTLIWETEIQHGEPLSKIRFYVECTEPFIVAPGLVKMHYEAATGDRRGKVGVANATDLPMKFTVEPPDRIHAPKELEVPGKQTVQLEVSLGADDVSVFKGEMWVISEPYRQRVLLEAAPEPPQAVLIEPKDAVIDFGTLPKGKTAQSKIVLKNIGGESSVLAAQVAPPFHVLESDSAVSIGPGETREMTVECVSPQAGKFSGNILFSGTGGKLSIAARFTVTDPNAPQSIRPSTASPAAKTRTSVAKPAGQAKGGAAPTPKDAAKPAQPAAATQKLDKPIITDLGKLTLGYLATWGMPLPKSMLSTKLQKVETIEVVQQGRDHLVLAWKHPEVKPESYKVQGGYRYSASTETPTRWLKAWRDMPGVEVIKGEEGKHTVRINDLRADTRYEIRVLGVDQDGKFSQPSDIYSIATAAPWHLPSWTWRALVAFALIIFIFIYIRVKRGSWDL